MVFVVETSERDDFARGGFLLLKWCILVAKGATVTGSCPMIPAAKYHSTGNKEEVEEEGCASRRVPNP